MPLCVEEDPMPRSSLAALSALALILVPGLTFTAGSASAQMPVSDWTERPDRHGPAGIRGDLLPPARALDLRLQFTTRSFEDHLVGRDEVPPILVLQDFDMVPLSRTSFTVALEAQVGLQDWLALGIRAPFVYNEAEFATQGLAGSVDASGVGDLEAHLMAGLHNRWPVRAHVGAGVAFPTGSVTHTGITADQPATSRILPYPLQTGSGTWALLPSGTLAVENEHGTVGIHGSGRIHLTENDRNWQPGDAYEGNVYMQYRFNDWIGGSVRVAVARWADVAGVDPAVQPQASPMHWTQAQGGTRVEIPVGMNVRFAQGALQGHRLGAEVLLPVHQDLNGPQLRSKWGVAASWGYTFGLGAEPAPPRPAAPAPRPPAPPAPPEEPGEPELSPTRICLSTGQNVNIYLTPQGDTLVGPQRISVREVGEAAAFPGTYAEGRGWFVNDETITVEERSYQKSGAEVGLDCTDLVQVAEYQGVPVFAVRGASRPLEVVYVPVRPGVWLAYRTDLARVRG
jgi:hypothetical protein